MSFNFSNNHDYHSRVFEWVLDAESLHRSEINDGPLFIALNGPQGSGKTTLTRELVRLGNEMGVDTLAVSIDDFYLSRSEQQALSQKHPENVFWQARGYPGTHDIELGVQTLEKLSQRKPNLKIPRYDKSAYSGKGDRCPESEWEAINPANLKVIFLEGWMLGFSLLSQQSLSLGCDLAESSYASVRLSQADRENLAEINQTLPDYEAWYQYAKSFIQLQIKDFSWILDWRVEAEENMKAQGRQGMTTAQAKAYAQLFLPAYVLFSPTLDKFAERFSNPLTLDLSKGRLPKVF